MRPDGSLDSSASLSGRKRMLTDQEVRTAYVEVLDWWLQGRPGPYSSAKELMSENAVVRQLVEQTGVSAKTLTRSLQQIDPKYHYGKYKQKSYLDDTHRDNRLEGVKLNRPIVDQQRGLILFAHEKVLCMNQEQCMGWFSNAHEDYGWKLPPGRKDNSIAKLKYIMVVNYVLGPVWTKCIGTMERLFYSYPVQAIQKDVDSQLATYGAIEDAAGL